MKKNKPRASARKPSPSSTAVHDYLTKVPRPARSTFSKLRAIVRSAVPSDAIEAVSYGILAFRQKKILLWFGAFSTHCSLFPTAEIIDDFQDQLKGHTISKGTIQFPLGEPLPAALIKSIVKARVARCRE